MDAARRMRHTVVQETVDRKWIESTMTEAVRMTERPTERYLETVHKQVNAAFAGES